MVSLKDIAIHCGVSVATVSKVLNGHSDIGEATRQKVLAAAADMGYTANAAARALKTPLPQPRHRVRRPAAQRVHA